MADDPLPIDDDMLAKVLVRGSFSTELNAKDLDRLRRIVKQVHMKHYPGEMVTDYGADRIIDVLAPETKDYLLRRAIQQKLVE